MGGMPGWDAGVSETACGERYLAVAQLCAGTCGLGALPRSCNSGPSVQVEVETRGLRWH